MKINLTGLNGDELQVDSDEIYNIHESSLLQKVPGDTDMNIVSNPLGSTIVELLKSNNKKMYLRVKETKKQVWEMYGL